MRGSALTYPQLVRQALSLQMDDALPRLRDTFAVAQRYFDGMYCASGKPLICHTVGTASILLEEHQPLPVVEAALVHAVYTASQYDGSTRRRPVPQLRRRVRGDVGDEVEAIVWAFRSCGWHRHGAPERIFRALPDVAPELRAAIAIQVANDLETHLDLGRQYEADRNPRARIKSDGPAILEVARALGMPTLADELSEVFRETMEETAPASAGRRPREYELPARETSRVNRATRFADRVRMGVAHRLRDGRSDDVPHEPSTTPREAASSGAARTSPPRPRILITGAAGRIGREIAPLLREHFVLRLIDVERIEPACDEDEIVRADIRNAAALRQACTDVAAIVHLAGVESGAGDAVARMMPVNIDGTYQVFEAARTTGVGRVILASTGQIVGGYPMSEWVSADSPVRPSSLYACTKVFGEALARYYAECHGIGAVCLRIGWFDVDDGTDVHSRPEMRWMWCSARDLAQIIVRSVQSDIRFAVLFAISDNPQRHWDLEVARDAVGYVAEDRAPEQLATADGEHA